MYSHQSERCECHACTQARWKMSMQGQIETAMQAQNKPMGQIPGPPEPDPLKAWKGNCQ